MEEQLGKENFITNLWCGKLQTPANMVLVCRIFINKKLKDVVFFLSFGSFIQFQHERNREDIHSISFNAF